MTEDATSPTKAPPPPAILVKHGRKDGAGRQLWKEIAGSGTTVPYVLRPDELRILRDACVLADRIDKLEHDAADRPSTVRGSQGQQVINPLLAEARQCQLALAALLAKIKLPEEQGQSDQPRSVAARNAAQSRWNKTG